MFFFFQTNDQIASNRFSAHDGLEMPPTIHKCHILGVSLWHDGRNGNAILSAESEVEHVTRLPVRVRRF